MPNSLLLVSNLTTILKQISSSTLAQFADVQWPMMCLQNAIELYSHQPKLSRKLLKLIAPMLEHLVETSKLAVVMGMLQLTKTLIANAEAQVWQGSKIRLSQFELLKETLAVSFKANNVCSL